MADFHNNIMYEASQLGVKVRLENGVYFCEGFEIKNLKSKLRISGYVWMQGTRSLQVLFETGSWEAANKSLRRTFLVSKEISRIKSFSKFRDDPRICVQIEFDHHADGTRYNFIAETKPHSTTRFQQTDCVVIGARYYVPCENDKSEWYFWIHNETYLERRLEDPKVLPHENNFTAKRKYAANDFADGAPIDSLQNLYKLGLPYRIVAIRVDKVEQYDEDARDVFKAYNIPLPPDKVQVEYIAVKVANPAPQNIEDNTWILAC